MSHRLAIGMIPTSTYSLNKNLRYMVMAFVQPLRLIDAMQREPSIFFGLVPFFIEKLLYQIAYILDCYKERSPSLIGASSLLGNHYIQYKPFLAPLLEVVNLFIFVAVIGSLARLRRYEKFDIIKATTFFMFLATFGLLAFAADMIYTYAYSLNVLLWLHPIIGAVALIYLTLFVSRQARLTRWRSFLLALPAWMAYFVFRIPFFM